MLVLFTTVSSRQTIDRIFPFSTFCIFFSLFTLTKGKSTYYINSGHINHSLFWENLAPKSKSGGDPPSGKLAESIDKTWGSYDSFKKAMNSALMGVQGSGWAWLIKDTETGSLDIVTRPVCLFFPLFFPSFILFFFTLI